MASPPTQKNGFPSEENNPPSSQQREVRPEIPDHQWENETPTNPLPPPNLEGMDFVPPSDHDPNMETIMGHEVHPVTHEELMRQHSEETGGAPLFESSMQPNQEATQRARRAQQVGVLEEEVDQLTPEWMRDRKINSSAQQHSTQVPPSRDTTKTAMPEVDMGDMKSVADAIRALGQQAARAQADGNIVGARALREAMEAISSSTEMERRYDAQKEHPVLQKLKGTLGLQRIKPVRKEWAGLFWNCYTSNMVLDAWFFDNLWDDRRNFASLKIATYCVGIDDVPIYKVFNVPLIHNYTVVGEEGELREVALKPYRKYCKSCGTEIELHSLDCKNCGASLDPFDIPLSLRIHCAEKLYTFFQEEFGPTEKLDVLVGMLREDLKDRLVDGDDLFPLAMLSVEAPTTDDSLSGEDQSQEPESSPPTPEQ